jgi:hypothetical protein
MLRKKSDGLFEDFETHFCIKWCYRLLKYHEAPNIVGQLYGMPHGIFHYFIQKWVSKSSNFLTDQAISIFSEHSTLAKKKITYSQARIEYTNFIIGDTPGCLNALKKMFKNNKVNPSSNDQALPYKMSALRIGITLSVLYFILVVILLPIATMFAQVVIIIGMGHCIFTGLPMLFICSHSNIKEYSVKRMKQLLCKNNVTDSCCWLH